MPLAKGKLHAATMPRIILRCAIEKLNKAQREHYLGLKAK